MRTGQSNRCKFAAGTIYSIQPYHESRLLPKEIFFQDLERITCLNIGEIFGFGYRSSQAFGDASINVELLYEIVTSRMIGMTSATLKPLSISPALFFETLDQFPDLK
jgi:hypothetical protein